MPLRCAFAKRQVLDIGDTESIFNVGGRILQYPFDEAKMLLSGPELTCIHRSLCGSAKSCRIEVEMVGALGADFVCHIRELGCEQG